MAESAKPLNIGFFQKAKAEGRKITALTAYDYSTAKCLDEAGVDLILVGDSLAMVALGYETTHQVGVEEMIVFTKAVAKGASRALVAVDMPFLSYHVSKESATQNAGNLIKNGAKAVKLEGASDYIIDVIKHLTEQGIPVIGHLGFTPQYLHALGGYNIQGKTIDKTLHILGQAKELEKAGVSAIVLEMVPEESADFITKQLTVPTIGIGAGRKCSGQILVTDDILGKYDGFTPKFAKKYADLKTAVTCAAKEYVKEVANSTFPSDNEVFHLTEEENQKLDDYVNKTNR